MNFNKLYSINVKERRHDFFWEENLQTVFSSEEPTAGWILGTNEILSNFFPLSLLLFLHMHTERAELKNDSF